MICRCLQPAQFVYQGICELFEMYLVHVFAAFADVSLSMILNPAAAEVRRTPLLFSDIKLVSGLGVLDSQWSTCLLQDCRLSQDMCESMWSPWCLIP